MGKRKGVKVEEGLKNPKEIRKHIVIQHARWGGEGNNRERNDNMDNRRFTIRNKEGGELVYGGIGGICY